MAFRHSVQRVYKITANGPLSVVRQESGLSDTESEALHDEAYRLMVDARVLGVGRQEDDDGITCVYILDMGGHRYTAARNAGAYLLLDPALRIVTISKQFDPILQALRDSL